MDHIKQIFKDIEGEFGDFVTYPHIKKALATALIKTLEGLKWTPRESWKDDVVRHNGQIDSILDAIRKESV